MPYQAINAQKVLADWDLKLTFESTQDIAKLDINVMTVAVQIQWLEGDDRFYTEDEKQFVLLRVGFQSIPFVTPIRRYRLRQWPQDPNYNKEVEGKVCEVDVREFS